VDVLLPYTRGDLVTRLHDRAEVLSTEHTADGTRVRARVGPDLAAVLEPFGGALGTA
jgi:GTP-binding protein HflX